MDKRTRLHPSIVLAAIAPLLLPTSGQAQTASPGIEPDATLPVPSRVEASPAGTRITGGTAAGSNLFHSFETFSVPAGSEARFAVESAAVDAIITRVTGDLASQIDGTLAVDGTASLFFLNPNGVFFGPNARLDLRGSFVASTADGIDFGDRGRFAADPAAGAAAPLLTVAPSALFFSQLGVAPIRNESTVGLAVDPGQSLLFAGGETTFTGGQAIAPAGRIDVVALAQPAEIGLATSDSALLSLRVPEAVVGAPLTLTGGAVLDTSGLSGGDVRVRAGSVAISTDAAIVANSFGSGPAGEIGIVADTTIEIIGENLLAEQIVGFLPLFVGALPEDGALGNLPQPDAQNGIFASSFGTGSAGSISLQATDIKLESGAALLTLTTSLDSSASGGNLNLVGANSVALTQGSGALAISLGASSSGEVAIETGSLVVSESLVVSSALVGQATGGDIIITATERVEASGAALRAPSLEFPGGIVTSTSGNGNAGNLTIATGTLNVGAGAGLITSSQAGPGRGGDIDIQATEAVELIGTAAFIVPLGPEQPGLQQPVNSLFAGSTGTGDTGNIRIETPSLSLSDGAAVSIANFGPGSGGRIEVLADTVAVTGSAPVAPLLQLILPGLDPTGAIDGIEITPEQVIGTLTDGLLAVSLGPGSAGDIDLQVGELALQNGATLAATSLLPEIGGAGGDINIAATQRTTVTGGSLVASGTTGSAPSGELTLSTPSLRVDGSLLTTSTAGSGAGGALEIVGAERIDLSGGLPIPNPATFLSSGLFTTTVGSGAAGAIKIETGELIIRDGASAATSSLGDTGAGGELSVVATQAIELSGQVPGTANLSASTIGAGNGGNITVTTPVLTLRDGGAISASTFGTGNGGNITIDADTVDIAGSAPAAPLLEAIVAPFSSVEDFGDLSAVNLDPELLIASFADGLFAVSLGPGDAGNIDLRAGELAVREGGAIATTSFVPFFGGTGGRLDITASESVALEGGSILVTGTTGEGPSGDLTITTPQLRAVDSLAITATAGAGAGGTIEIREAERVEIAGTIFTDSLGTIPSGFITASIGPGQAGALQIDTGVLVVRDGATALTNSLSDGESGDLTVVATESVELSAASPGVQNGSLSAGTAGSGDGGDIFIETPRLILGDGGSISASAFGPGDGGNIAIEADLVEITGGTISANTFGFGSGGDIEIEADTIAISGQASVAPLLDIFLAELNLSNLGSPPDIPEEVLIESLSDGLFAASLGPGSAGSVTLQTGVLSLQDGAGIATSSFLDLDLAGLPTPSVPAGAGTLRIAATERIDFESGSFLASATASAQPAGDLTLETPELKISNSIITTSALSGGAGGTLTILGSERVELAGFLVGSLNPDGTPAPAGLITATGGDGAAGEIQLETGTLIVRDGASIASSTLGQGDGGTLNIVATESVELVGLAAGPPGTASLQASSSSAGNAGDIFLQTPRLQLREGGAIAANTFGPGAGGNIQIAAEDIEIAGTSPLSSLLELVLVSPPSDGLTTEQISSLLESGLFTLSADPAPGVSAGPAGSITIQGARSLRAIDGATISTATFGSNTAGSLTLEANEVLVQNSLLATNTFGPQKAGDIEIETDRLRVLEGGLISATALNPGQTGAGGNLTVTARESVELAGVAPGTSLGGLLTTTAGAGDAGNIFIETGRLSARDGAQINSSTSNSGNGGAIAIQATEIDLSGGILLDPDNPESFSPSGIAAVAGADSFSADPSGAFGAPAGNAGNIDITLLDGGQLTVRAGAAIAANTDANTFGMGGQVEVDAGGTDRGTIFIEGIAAGGAANSTIAAFTFGEGPAQSVELRAQDIRLEDGGTIVAATVGIGPGSSAGSISLEADTVVLQGVPVGAPLATGLFTVTLGEADAGGLTVEAREVSILGGAIATTSSIDAGNSGILRVVATDSITVAGVSESGEIVSSLVSTTFGTGSAGELQIDVPNGTLAVTDNAFVGAGTVNPFLGETLVFFFPGIGAIPIPSVGSGNGGVATIQAKTVTLDNGGISTATASNTPGSNNEGSLNLIVSENLLLFNNSEISAAALGASNGGNLLIDASDGNILLNGNSRIVANAETGDGGNIQIETTGFFPCPTCPVTASSNLGVDGEVQVSSPEVNPAASLVVLSARLRDPAKQIVTSCAAGEGNRFAVVGRSGLPASPSDRLQSPEPWTDLRVLAPTEVAIGSAESEPPPPARPFQEATGWRHHPGGEIELVAASNTERWRSQQPHCGDEAAAERAAAAPTVNLAVDLGVSLP